MNNREELRRKGNEIRERLQHGTFPVRERPRAVAGIPGLRNYTAEAIFGAVWARPGLDIRYRMLATLSVLTSLQRLSQFQTYVHSALNMGLGAEEIQEVPIHCSLYAGFPSAVNSLELVHEAFRERGIEAPQTEVPELSLEEMEARGRELREQLFGDLGQEGYASALVDLAPDLRVLTYQYGFGEIFFRPGLDLNQGGVRHRRADGAEGRWPVAEPPAGRPSGGPLQGGNGGGADPDRRIRGLSGGVERDLHSGRGLDLNQRRPRRCCSCGPYDGGCRMSSK